MATKSMILCDKCGHEAPDPNALPPGASFGMPMPVPMLRDLPSIDTAWWRFLPMSFGTAHPIDLCPACARAVLDFLQVTPRQLGDEIMSPPIGSLSLEELRKMGLVPEEAPP